MKCIFCMEEKTAAEFSAEHVFPDAIGGKLIIKNVCKCCNDYLGRKVDWKLTDNFLIKMARYQYKIPNKQGEIPSPFDVGVKEGTQEKVAFRIDKKTGESLPPYVLPTKIKEIDTGDNKTKRFEFKLDKRDKGKALQIIKKYFERNQIKQPTNDELLKIINAAESKKEQPLLEYKLKFDMIEYKRAILKIIYELACYWLPEEYLNDNMAEELRKVIIDGNIKNAKINGKIDIGNSILSKLTFDRQTLTAFAVVDRRNQINIMVKIFDVFEGAITVTKNAQKYSMTQENAPAIEINVCNHNVIESTFEQFVLKRFS